MIAEKLKKMEKDDPRTEYACTVWDSVSQCYMARKTDKKEPGRCSRQARLELSGYRQDGVPRQSSLSRNRTDQRSNPDQVLMNNGDNSKDENGIFKKNFRNDEPEHRRKQVKMGSPSTSPKLQQTQTEPERNVQKAVWNSNGSITVLETLPGTYEAKVPVSRDIKTSQLVRERYPGQSKERYACLAEERYINLSEERYSSQHNIRAQINSNERLSFQKMENVLSFSQTRESKTKKILQKEANVEMKDEMSEKLRSKTNDSLCEAGQIISLISKSEEDDLNCKARDFPSDRLSFPPSDSVRHDTQDLSEISTDTQPQAEHGEEDVVVSTARTCKQKSFSSCCLIRNFAIRGRRVINLGDSLQQNKRFHFNLS